MADTTTKSAGTYGRLLASQPCETEAIHYTHFDCWPGGDDSVYPDEINQSANAAADYWQHPACVELAHRLCDEWAESIGTVYLRTLIPSLSMNGWFAFAATLFVHAGYSVYNSDTCFEVFRTDELISNGEEMEEDV